MLVMSERGADELLSSKFTLGAEGSVAAGPSAARRLLKPTRKCRPRFFRGQDPKGCLPASPWKGRP